MLRSLPLYGYTRISSDLNSVRRTPTFTKLLSVSRWTYFMPEIRSRFKKTQKNFPLKAFLCNNTQSTAPAIALLTSCYHTCCAETGFNNHIRDKQQDIKLLDSHRNINILTDSYSLSWADIGCSSLTSTWATFSHPFSSSSALLATTEYDRNKSFTALNLISFCGAVNYAAHLNNVI